MNSVHLIGRLTAQPELRYTPKGLAVANSTLAVDDGYGDNKTTLFIGLTFWDKSAENAGKHLVKGQKIGVTGKLTQEEFTPKGSDKPTRKTHVTVITFDFLEKPQGYERDDQSRSQGEGYLPAAQQRRESPPPLDRGEDPDGDDDGDDDIPF